MAGPAWASTIDHLTCALCMEVFTKPKALPCLHTYCQKCLQDLAAQNPGQNTLPCPTCRVECQIPQGGVDNFQTNFWIKEEDLKRAKTLCSYHGKEKTVFCIDCKVPMCIVCKRTSDHRSHKSEPLQTTVERHKDLLTKLDQLLKLAIRENELCIEHLASEQVAVEKKRKVLVVDILKRYDALCTIIADMRDSAIQSLRTMSDEIVTNSNLQEKDRKDKDAEMKTLQQKVGQWLERVEVDNETVFRDIAKQKTLLKAMADVEPLLRNKLPVIRPVLGAGPTTEEMAKAVCGFKGFLGEIRQVSLQSCPPELGTHFVEVGQVGGSGAYAEPFSLCGTEKEDLIAVSYEPTALNPAREPEFVFVAPRMNTPEAIIFGKKGRVCFTSETFFGISFKESENTESLLAKSASGIHLQNYLDYKRMQATKVTVNQDGASELKVLFDVNCGPIRTADMDKRERYLVLVEEPKPPGSKRSVLLYLQSVRTDTYRPPTLPQPAHPLPTGTQGAPSPTAPQAEAAAPNAPSTSSGTVATPSTSAADAAKPNLPPPTATAFQPSDVCFWHTGEREVLVVSDEAGDCLHIVGIEKGRFKFEGYLAPGIPNLTQPTALNVDRKGRLLVGCRGGAVLRFSSLEKEAEAEIVTHRGVKRRMPSSFNLKVKG